MLGVAIPTSDEVEMMGEERNPVAVFAPEGAATVAYAGALGGDRAAGCARQNTAP